MIDWSKENLEKLVKQSWCQCDVYQKLTGKWDTNEKLMRLIKLYNIDISHWRKQLPELEKDDLNIIPINKRQEKMLELRKQGKTFKEIAEEIGCSKSSVSYFFRKNTRSGVKQRHDKYSKWEECLIRNVSRFQDQEPYVYIKSICKDWKLKLRSSTNKFIKRGGYVSHFGYKDVLNKYNNCTNVTCYLTGDQIDLTKDDYSLDHIIPISRGGSCELDNLGITTFIANQAKSSMTEDEFVELCKKVLIHHGYEIKEKEI